jgi:hypothetical protein
MDKIACGAYWLLDSSTVRSGKGLAHDNFPRKQILPPADRICVTKTNQSSSFESGPLPAATITPASSPKNYEGWRVGADFRLARRQNAVAKPAVASPAKTSNTARLRPVTAGMDNAIAGPAEEPRAPVRKTRSRNARRPPRFSGSLCYGEGKVCMRPCN